MRKLTNNYFFSVEGHTERYYLQWLSFLINNHTNRTHNVSFNIKITNSPISYAKGLTTMYPATAFHITDVESLDDEHQSNFIKELDEMRFVEHDYCHKINNYILGYTNYTFELWLLFHKTSLFGYRNHRDDYLTDINREFNRSFTSMSDYKNEQSFKNILNDLKLENVIQAINRGERIILQNKNNGYVKQNYKNHKYYKENPSLSIHNVVKVILSGVGLM